MSATKPAPSTAASRSEHVATADRFGSPSSVAPSPQTHAMVLIVATTSAVRAELRAGLDGLAWVRVVEASSLTTALELSRELVLHLVVADVEWSAITRGLPWLQTVLVAESDTTPAPQAGQRTHLMHHPFAPETMRAAVTLLLRR